jgi:aminoglycoside/choline kinase family phosphotransferase
MEELGLDDAMAAGLVLIEWPERIADGLPPDRLDIRLADGRDAAHRRLDLCGQGEWQARLDRFTSMHAFLARSGWGDAATRFLQGDASPRRYARLTLGQERALLMDAPRQPDGPPIRDGLPYSAIAHLAEDVRAFVAVDGALARLGLSVPEILAHDLERGFLVIEDLGDRVFQSEIPAGADQATLTRAAVDVLVALRAAPPPSEIALPDGTLYALPRFDRSAFFIEIGLLLGWFWPAVYGEPVPTGLADEFEALWAPLFDGLQDEPQGWLLRDYHSPNLIWLPDREGIARVGLIDFQDALRGPPAYDMVSLLQDARIDVPAALEGALLAHYCAGSAALDSSFDLSRFQTAYAILGAQRTTKILGIFARLAARDGKTGYLTHIPRVSAYLERNLAHPALAGLKAWFDAHLPAERRRVAGTA